jgi:hypothetical protein
MIRNTVLFFLFAGISGLIFIPALSAQDIYWEEPQLFYSGSGTFPVSA